MPEEMPEATNEAAPDRRPPDRLEPQLEPLRRTVRRALTCAGLLVVGIELAVTLVIRLVDGSWVALPLVCALLSVAGLSYLAWCARGL